MGQGGGGRGGREEGVIESLPDLRLFISFLLSSERWEALYCTANGRDSPNERNVYFFSFTNLSPPKAVMVPPPPPLPQPPTQIPFSSLGEGKAPKRFAVAVAVGERRERRERERERRESPGS